MTNENNQKKWFFRNIIAIMWLLFISAILLAFFAMVLSNGNPSKTATTITIALFTITIKIFGDLFKYFYK